MIKADVITDESGNITRFSVKGHSGFAKSGDDIVCAAVSMLVINTISSIEKFCSDVYELKSDTKKGLIFMTFLKKPSCECKLLLDSMLLGLESVRAEYGKKYLDLSYKEEASC